MQSHLHTKKQEKTKQLKKTEVGSNMQKPQEN